MEMSTQQDLELINEIDNWITSNELEAFEGPSASELPSQIDVVSNFDVLPSTSGVTVGEGAPLVLPLGTEGPKWGEQPNWGHEEHLAHSAYSPSFDLPSVCSTRGSSSKESEGQSDTSSEPIPTKKVRRGMRVKKNKRKKASVTCTFGRKVHLSVQKVNGVVPDSVKKQACGYYICSYSYREKPRKFLSMVNHSECTGPCYTCRQFLRPKKMTCRNLVPMLSELNLMRIFDNVEALSPDSRWQMLKMLYVYENVSGLISVNRIAMRDFALKLVREYCHVMKRDI